MINLFYFIKFETICGIHFNHKNDIQNKRLVRGDEPKGFQSMMRIIIKYMKEKPRVHTKERWPIQNCNIIIAVFDSL